MKDRPAVPKITEIMTTQVSALGEDFSVKDALAFFNHHRFSAAPVVNINQDIVGYLSEREVLECLSHSLFFDEVRYPQIKQIMQIKIHTLNESDSIFDAEHLFLAQHVRYAPVVNTQGKMVGIVSLRDVLRALEGLIRDVWQYKEDIKKPIELNLTQQMNQAAQHAVGL